METSSVFMLEVHVGCIPTASLSSIHNVFMHLWIAFLFTNDHAFKCVNIPKCYATAAMLISSLKVTLSELKLPLESKALVIKDSPSRVELPEYKKLNMALYELRSKLSSYKFTVLGETACFLINAPIIMQKLFLFIMLSSSAS